ncbi:MAG TPA: zinc ribbon domain-containing protein [Longimicrobiales bacterium]|jgi:putative FmdB family regulatory protein
MPLYEYACRSCGAAFERRLNFEERLAAQTCPECGGKETSLLLSVPALAGSRSDADSWGHCPTTGRPCGCAHAIRD